ncbi:catalase [Botrytis cinerea]
MYLATVLSLVGLVTAQCPYGMDKQPQKREPKDSQTSSSNFLDQFTLNDTNTYFTTDAGGLYKRTPVPERAVHARGAGAHGIFTSYGNYSNITAASFLNQEGKETPVFVRFSTVAGSRGSADTARDVHGFATRFYTDEGNFDIVGNNIPVFFIQDAILFPDLIHAVKPSPDNEIPQAATAHDSAWDFFSQQPSSLHTLFWAMAGNGIPRSFRHMDGFGIHTFRLVTDSGTSKLVKWHWKSKQGKASLVWEEAQVLAGKNADFHRKDLWDAIESGNGPEWELGIQIILPEELVPVQKIGVMRLNANPRNYFAETEQVMFQPGHIVRGIDFTDDPLLQGRIFSYLDTQLNRHGGPNFEQLPINRPIVPVHNNNRDGAAQQYIPLNTAAYSPNTLNDAAPKQANQTVGRGFFTAPGRTVSGHLVREVSSTFSDVWSQPRLFYNSLIPVEQQFLINAIRFETSQLTSSVVKSNVLIQLNRVSHDLAARVASVLNLPVPEADNTYYNDNKTSSITIFGNELPTIATLNVGVLVSVKNNATLTQAANLATSFSTSGVNVKVIGEILTNGVDATYSASDATLFDGIIVTDGAENLFTNGSKSTYFPADRPRQILLDAYNWGKPVGTLGNARTSLNVASISTKPGVYSNSTSVSGLVKEFEAGLKTFRFVDRFALDD